MAAAAAGYLGRSAAAQTGYTVPAGVRGLRRGGARSRRGRLRGMGDGGGEEILSLSRRRVDYVLIR